MFLEPDDYLILMNIPMFCSIGKPIRLVGDDVKRLRDAGIKTMIEYAWGGVIEARPAQRNYAMIEDYIANARQGDMKIILPFPILPSQHLPSDWYCQFSNGGRHMERTSLWNPEAIAYEIEFLEDLIARYSAPDVQFVYSGYLMDESVLHNVPCIFDPAAKRSRAEAGVGSWDVLTNEQARDWLARSVVEHYVGVQDVLRRQHGEIWDFHQWCIAQQSPFNGNFAQELWLHRWRDLWPDVSIVLLQYTCFAHGEPYPTFVNDLMEAVDLRVIVEADYCKGVTEKSRAAKARGYHGNIIGPVHPWGGETELTPWMVDVIEEAVDFWRAERC